MLVLLLAFASVSPQIHQALHAKSESSHQCDAHHEDAPTNNSDDSQHSCAVTLFSQGATSPLARVELPERTDATLAMVALTAEVVWCGQAPIRRCSRAPPIETVV
jgi:hypothetical protein